MDRKQVSRPHSWRNGLLAAVWLGLSAGLCGACPSGPGCSPCDWDSDGDIDCEDIRLFCDDFTNGNQCADFNQDGAVDFEDYLAFLACHNASLASCPHPPLPTNDNCATPIALTGHGTVAYELCFATTGAQGQGSGCGSGGGILQDVWYTWTAPCTGMATFTTGALTTLDTRIAVYAGTGCPGALSTAIACNDDISTTFFVKQSLVRFPVTIGQKFTIQVGLSPAATSCSDQYGPGQMRFGVAACPADFELDCDLDCDDYHAFNTAYLANSIAADFNGDGFVTGVDQSQFISAYTSPAGPCTPQPLPPANDTCSTAIARSLPSTTAFNTTCASMDGPQEPRRFFPDANIDRDIWYSVTPATSGTLTADIGPTGFAVRLGVYSPGGCPVGAGRLLAADDATFTQGCAPSRARVTLQVTGGQTYLIRVGGATGQSGTGTLSLSFSVASPCPPSQNSPSRTSAYIIKGPGVGTNWSWSVRTPCTSVTNQNTPGVNGSTAALGSAFAASINAAASLAGCPIKSLSAKYGGKGLSIRVGGTDQPELWVGPAGAAPTCLVGPGPGVPPYVGNCTFNPEIEEVVLSGLDCNGNGEDDTIDIFEGFSLDANNDGIPDECQCRADFNHDGFLDYTDFDAFVQAFEAGTANADFNNDGFLDFTDFDAFVTGFEHGC